MSLLRTILTGRPARTTAPQAAKTTTFKIRDNRGYEILHGTSDLNVTGLAVDAHVALSFSPWWRGLNLIANSVGKLPLYLYRRQPGGGKLRDKTHAAYRLIRRKPNPHQTAFQFRRQLTGHAVSRGNGYAWIERDEAARPLALWPLDPRCTRPCEKDGQLLYETHGGGETYTLWPEDVLHIRGLGFDGIQGYDVVSLAAEAVGLGLVARRSIALDYKTGNRQAVVLQSEQVLDEEWKKRFGESFRANFSGLENKHRTPILDAGLKAVPISFSNEQQQTMELLGWTYRDVANYLLMPSSKVNDPTGKNFSTLEQEDLAFLGECLDTWLCGWETESDDKLLTEREQAEDTHFAEFNRKAIIRLDARTEAEVLRIYTGGQPLMTVDEGRGVLNLPEKGGAAAELSTPMNVDNPGGNPQYTDETTRPAPPQTPAPRPPATPDPNQARLGAALRGGVAVAALRLVRRISAQAERAAKKPKEFTAWLDTFQAEHRAAALDYAEWAEASARAFLGQDDQVRELGPRLLARLHREYAGVAETATAASLAAAVQAKGAELELHLPAEAADELFGE